MKNIVLIGASRAGKSTFSKMIINTFSNCMLIRGDFLRLAYRDVIYKDSSVKTSMMKNEKDYLDYVLSYYDYAVKYDPEYIKILDTVDFLPSDYKKINDSLIICFGYPSISPLEAVKNWRTYDTNHDWTKDKSEDELLVIAKKEIDNSKYLKIECEKYNIKYVDTSYDRDKVLNELLEYVKENIE